MPIILPKCPTGYELNKDNCRCKKSVTRKKTPKKVKKWIQKAKEFNTKLNNGKFYGVASLVVIYGSVMLI